MQMQRFLIRNQKFTKFSPEKPSAQSLESCGCSWIAVDWDGCDSHPIRFLRKVIAFDAN
jgi:hypothetical protein